MGRASLVPYDFCNLRNASDRELMPAGAIAWATDKVRVKTGVQSLIDHLWPTMSLHPSMPGHRAALEARDAALRHRHDAR